MATIVFVILLLHAVLSRGDHNVTIENDTGDAETGLLPIYEPLNAWQNASFLPKQGDNNPFDLQGPADVTTSMYSSVAGSAWMTLLFDGTAIFVTCVLTSGTTQLNFILDDEPVPFVFQYQQAIGFDVYNATVYSYISITSIPTGPSGMHNLTITSPYSISFDFAEYTVPDVTATTSGPISVVDDTSGLLSTSIPGSGTPTNTSGTPTSAPETSSPGTSTNVSTHTSASAATASWTSPSTSVISTSASSASTSAPGESASAIDTSTSSSDTSVPAPGTSTPASELSTSAPGSPTFVQLSSRSTLSNGAIAGIVIGVLVAVLTLIGVGYKLWRRRRHSNTTHSKADLPNSTAFKLSATEQESLHASTDSLLSSHDSREKPYLAFRALNARTASSNMRPLPTPPTIMNAADLTAQLEYLQTQAQLQTTSTMALRDQIIALEDQLLSISAQNEPPPRY